MSITVLSVSYPLAPVADNTPGGAEQILATLDQAIVEAGHRSLVIAPQGSEVRGTLLPIAASTAPLDNDSRQNAWRQTRAAMRMALDTLPVDVVHMHGIDFLEYLPQPGKPVLSTLHLPLNWYPPDLFSLTRPDTHLVCVSEAQKKEVGGARSWRVVHNGVDLQRFQPTGKKKNYALALGRVCPEKGFHLALEAAKKAKLEFILAGQVFAYASHQEYFEKSIRPGLTSQCHFVGPVGGDHKLQLLSEARCLVVPSLVAETSCLVAMEALACGTPVVAFRRGALPEIVEHGQTGFLVDTPEQMAEAIRDAGQLSSITCRQKAERSFSSAGMIRSYLSLYHELARAKPRSIPRAEAA